MARTTSKSTAYTVSPRTRSLRVAIRKRYESAGLTASAASREIGGVTRPGFQRWLDGTVPNSSHEPALAAWLGVSVERVRAMREWDLARRGWGTNRARS